MRAAKGEGSAFKSGAGYRGYVTVNGKRKYFTAKTKAEAAQKRRELLTRREAGVLVTGKTQTVEQWLRHWLTVAKHRHTTEAMNRWVIETRIIPELGAIRLPALTTEQIEQWVAELGVSPSSQRRYLAPFTTALELAARRGHIPFNPAARVELEPQARPQTSAFSREDRDAILRAATGWNAARWHLGLRLGLRPSEALGLSWPDFDERAGTLTVRNQLLYAKGYGIYLQPAAKTSAGERTIILPKSLVTLLQQHHREQQEYIGDLGTEWLGWAFAGEVVALLFPQRNGKPHTARTDTRAWKALLTAAGLPEERRYKQRHTAATHMIDDSGGDVAVTAKNLGHSDPAFTYRVYAHPLEQRERDLADRMDAPYDAPYDVAADELGRTSAKEVAP